LSPERAASSYQAAKRAKGLVSDSLVMTLISRPATDLQGLERTPH
jgi:hypothetical protein